MTGADIRVVTHLTTIPVNLLLIAWVGVGRAAFLPDATATVRPLTLTVITPALIVLLGITTVAAVRQHRPAAGYLTAAQFGSLLGCWLTLAGFGFVLVDDAPDPAGGASPFTELVGDRFVPLSDALTVACLYGFIACYIALLILLIRGLNGARGRRLAGVGPAGSAHLIVRSLGR